MLNPNFNLRERLAAADRFYQAQEGLRLLCRSVPWSGGFFLLVLTADLVFRLADSTRCILLVSTGAAHLLLFAYAAWIALVRANSPERIARILESRDHALGSSLINFLHLENDLRKVDQPALTRDLAVHALENYQHRLRPADLQTIARTPEVKTDSHRAAMAAGLVVAVLVVSFPASRMLLPRFFDPFGGHPPFSLVRLSLLEPADNNQLVIYGHDLTVKAASIGHAPSELYVSYWDPAHPDQVSTLPMFDKGKGQFQQQVKNVTSELILYAHTKDSASLSPRRKIGLILPPEISRAFVTVQPPAYTGIAAREEPWFFKNLQVLKGSVLRFRIESNRPLAGGTVRLFGPGPESAISLQSSGEKTVTGELTALESGTLEFGVKDVAGLPSQKNPAASLTVVQDLPPEISIDEPSRDSFVSESFTVNVKISASDDFGVKTIRVHRALNGTYTRPLTWNHDKPVRKTEHSFSFNLPELGLKSGDLLTFYAEAIDSCPDGHVARSQTITLTVISDEEYNDYLRQLSDLSHLEQKYAELTRSLEDLAARQQELADKIQKLRDQLAADPKSASAEALKKRLEDLQETQARLNQEMKNLAEKMENFVRKDPLYDVEKDFQDILRQQAELLRKTADQAENSLQNSRGQFQQNADASAALAHMGQAAQEQADQLRQRRDETDKGVNQAIRDMQPIDNLTKDFNYFQFLYRRQEQIAAHAKAYRDRSELSAEDKMALNDLGAEQKEVQGELERLINRLRQDAAAAETHFPKAAQSGRDLADQMEKVPLPPLAGRAAQNMALGDGAGSAGLSENVREEMEKLMGSCEGGMGSCNQELDQHLQAQRKMNPRRTYQQMAMSRRFGPPSPGRGQGRGMGITGSGFGSGGSGYSVPMEGFGVLGQEGEIGGGSASGNGNSQKGVTGDKIDKVDLDKTHTPEDIEKTRQDSEAVDGEVSIEKYREAIDAYFEKATR